MPGPRQEAMESKICSGRLRYTRIVCGGSGPGAAPECVFFPAIGRSAQSAERRPHTPRRIRATTLSRASPVAGACAYATYTYSRTIVGTSTTTDAAAPSGNFPNSRNDA